MIGDEHATVAVDLQAVGLAVVLEHHLEPATGVDAQETAVRQVDAPQVPLAIERRAFEERVHLHVAVGEPLRGTIRLVHRFRQAREHLGVRIWGRGTWAFSQPSGSSMVSTMRAQRLAVRIEPQRAGDAAGERVLDHEVERRSLGTS